MEVIDHTGGLLRRKDLVKTDLHCTECSKYFVASIDHNVEGNHIIECPWCRHEHCRVITAGMVTGDRWDSRYQRVDVPKRSVWRSQDLPIATSSASAFIRDMWLNRDAE